MEKTEVKASVTTLKNKDGSIRGYWVRGPRQNGKQPSLKIFKPHEEAAARDFAAGALFVVQAESVQLVYRHSPDSFVGYGETVLDQREKDGHRSMKDERNRYKLHVAQAPFAGKPLREITAQDVAQWIRSLSNKAVGGLSGKRRPRKLSRRTVQLCLSLASVIFSEAFDARKIDGNPCAGVRIKTVKARVKEPWDYLRLPEQIALAVCSDLSVYDRLAIRFSIGTGIRAGEQRSLRLEDVHLNVPRPHIVIRYGSPHAPPKNGKIRHVPLFGDALQASKEWMLLLPLWLTDAKGHRWDNGHGLMWPSQHGCFRGKSRPLGKRFDALAIALKKIGVDRPMRWHDLRHTCASSLISGWWGRVWTLPEVKEMLGHSSIQVTERYAHLGETALTMAAQGTNYSLTGPVLRLVSA